MGGRNLDQNCTSSASVPARARNARYASDRHNPNVHNVVLNPNQRVQRPSSPLPVHQHLRDSPVSDLLR